MQQIALTGTLPNGTFALAPGQVLNECHVEGYGTTLLVTDKSAPAVTLGSNVTLRGMTFLYPEQDGSVRYPPLFADQGQQVNNVTLLDVDVVNAWDGFVQGEFPGTSWGSWNVRGGRMFACNDLFRLCSTGGSWRIVGTDFSPSLWGSLVGLASIEAALEDVFRRNTLLHVFGPTANSVTLAMSACTAFGWRRGLRVEPGGVLSSGSFDVLWDGTAAILDTWDGGTAIGNVFGGSGLSYIPSFSKSTQGAQVWTFAIGAGGDLNLIGFQLRSDWGCVISQGAPIRLRGCDFLFLMNGGPAGAAACAQGTGTSEMIVDGCKFDAGSPGQVAVGGNPKLFVNNDYAPNVRPTW